MPYTYRQGVFSDTLHWKGGLRIRSAGEGGGEIG